MRSLVLGNGSTLVGIDSNGYIRDLYFDYVGLENHMLEDSVNRIGIFINNKMLWFDSSEFSKASDYRQDSLTGTTILVNRSEELEISIVDACYNESDIILRHFRVKNTSTYEKNLKIFFCHQFRMYGTRKGDSVYFDPADHSIVHYKGRRIAIISGKCDGREFNQYTVGLSNIEGKEGTWMDAMDGVLSRNPVEHGSVDSTIGFDLNIKGNSEKSVFVWICMAKTLSEAHELNNYVNVKTPEHLIRTTHDYWRAWISKSSINYRDLSQRAIDLYKKSLLIVRAHIDNKGAIIASSDSEMLFYGRDSYSYVWMRDSAFVVMAMNKATYHEVTLAFFEFCMETLSNEGYFFQRYRPDRSLASTWHPWVSSDGERTLAIQEDETALILISLWDYYEKTKNLEFIEKLYNPLIKKMANFILEFRNDIKLPNPSYDLWEMKLGIHTFTACSSYKALKVAASFAKLLGKEDQEKLYTQGAIEIKEAIIKYLYDPKEEVFYKSIFYENGKIEADKTIDASSFYGVYKFEVLDPFDQRLVRAFEKYKEKLENKTGIGGIIRFENDLYLRESDQNPPNPWIVTTLWFCDYIIATSKSVKDLDEAKKGIEWVCDRALASGILPEQSQSISGKQLSATPLTWSHSQYILTILNYLEKKTELINKNDNK